MCVECPTIIRKEKYSLKEIVKLVNSVLPNEEKIKPIGKGLYEAKSEYGEVVQGSLICVLYAKLLKIWESIDWDWDWSKVEEEDL